MCVRIKLKQQQFWKKKIESRGKSREANSPNQTSGCPENHCYPRTVIKCQVGQWNRRDSMEWEGLKGGTEERETERSEIESQT